MPPLAPVNINYHTDSGLLATCRVAMESLIDVLYLSQRELWPTKSLTYRRKARRSEVSFSKRCRKTKR